MAFGVTNEFGKLKTVLVHEPGTELCLAAEPEKWLFDAVPDAVLAKTQHRAFVKLLSSKGARVLSVPATDRPVPNLYFTRDHGFCLENGFWPGELNAIRAPERALVLDCVQGHGIPVLAKPFAGNLEGGDVFVWDEDTLLLGQSVRTTANPKDVAEATGKKVIGVRVPPQFIHLDLVFCMLSPDAALASTRHLPDALKRFLRENGVDVVPANEKGLRSSCANTVSLDKRTLIAPSVNVHTNGRLNEAGFSVLEADLSELLKGGGGPRCMTLALRRERL